MNSSRKGYKPLSDEKHTDPTILLATLKTDSPPAVVSPPVVFLQKSGNKADGSGTISSPSTPSTPSTPTSAISEVFTQSVCEYYWVLGMFASHKSSLKSVCSDGKLGKNPNHRKTL